MPARDELRAPSFSARTCKLPNERVVAVGAPASAEHFVGMAEEPRLKVVKTKQCPRSRAPIGPLVGARLDLDDGKDKFGRADLRPPLGRQRVRMARSRIAVPTATSCGVALSRAAASRTRSDQQHPARTATARSRCRQAAVDHHVPTQAQDAYGRACPCAFRPKR
jgi:hypothetical protein